MSHTEPLFGFNLQQKKSLVEFLVSIGVLASDDIQDADNNLQAQLTVQSNQIAAIAAWGTALATKLNADFVAQNALAQTPAHTLDVNYDTTPLA